MIDLHLHTTASDGRSTPYELVEQAALAGVRVMAVTDHDTTSAAAEAQACAGAHGIETVPGIEITAIVAGRDVHMLGYFMHAAEPSFVEFLTVQRAARVARIEAIGERLSALGKPISVEPMLAQARLHPGRSLGRPLIARAMVAAGHVKDVREAFDDWLADGGPAFVPRVGPTPADVLRIVHGAGGLVSLAHPGRTRIDEGIPAMRDAGLDAIEVFHCDHDPERIQKYASLARELDLLVTGGSDFHGDTSHGLTPGAVTLPGSEWERLSAARHRHG
jgi:predicted metal-dependent phosphoesterase TrpH